MVVPGHVRDAGGWPPALWYAGWLLLAVMVFHVAALAVTGGPVTGPVSLRKPATFAETSWLLCWSVALVMARLRLGQWRQRLVGIPVLAFGLGETSVMAIQAWRGVPSHYNFTTTFDAVLMRAGAGGLAFLMLAGVAVLLLATRGAGLPRSEIWGVRAGAAVLLIGCAVGFVMISNMSGVFDGSFASAFGRPQEGYLGPSSATVGHEYVLLRPHTDGGDLVLLHAIGVHGLPLLTLPALLLGRTVLSEPRRRLLVATMSGSVLAGLAVLAAQAFSSRPWDTLPAVALVMLALLVAAYLGALAVTVMASRRERQDVPRIAATQRPYSSA